MRVLDTKRDLLAVEAEGRRRVPSGGQHAEARWMLDAIPTVNAFKDGGMAYAVLGRNARSVSAPPVRD